MVERFELEAVYADACPLHSRVERAVHADLAGGWVAEYVLRTTAVCANEAEL